MRARHPRPSRTYNGRARSSLPARILELQRHARDPIGVPRCRDALAVPGPLGSIVHMRLAARQKCAAGRGGGTGASVGAHPRQRRSDRNICQACRIVTARLPLHPTPVAKVSRAICAGSLVSSTLRVAEPSALPCAVRRSSRHLREHGGPPVSKLHGKRVSVASVIFQGRARTTTSYTLPSSSWRHLHRDVAGPQTTLGAPDQARDGAPLT